VYVWTSVLLLTAVEQIITTAHSHLQSRMHRPTNESGSHAKNQVSLTHFTG